MSLLDWLLGKGQQAHAKSSSANDARLYGDGEYDFEIVGESFYQDALDEIAGPKTEHAAEHYCEAVLVCEANNPHDPNAVAVFIEGKKVGHLARELAFRWRELTLKHTGSLSDQIVDAVIVGGWKTDDDEGHYGVKLDM